MVLATSALAVLGQTATGATSHACPKRNIVATNSKLTLFFRVADDGYRDLYACVPGRGSTTDPIGDDTYVPGTVSLNGWIASYGRLYCDDFGTHCSEGVGAYKIDDLLDLRLTTRYQLSNTFNTPAFDDSRGYGRIGATRSTTDLSVVWIACHTRGPVPSYKPPMRGPECIHAGKANNEVWYRNSTDDNQSRMLDHGTGVDPSSLTLNGRRFTWRHSGKLHTYIAPPSPLPPRTMVNPPPAATPSASR